MGYRDQVPGIRCDEGHPEGQQHMTATEPSFWLAVRTCLFPTCRLTPCLSTYFVTKGAPLQRCISSRVMCPPTSMMESTMTASLLHIKCRFGVGPAKRPI